MYARVTCTYLCVNMFILVCPRVWEPSMSQPWVWVKIYTTNHWMNLHQLEPLPGFSGHELCWGSTWFSQLSRRPTPTWVSKFRVKQIGRLMSSTRFYTPQDIDNMVDQWISGFLLTKFTSCRLLHLLLGQLRVTLQRLSRCGTGSPWHPGAAGYAYPSWSPETQSVIVVS